MHRPVALLTGFEPYGGHAVNPSQELVKRLDGEEIAGHRVAGRVLPVAMGQLRACVADLLAETAPAVVVSLGLAAGEPTIRLERIGLNLADFEIADNDGTVCRDDTIVPGGPAALPATLPLRAVETALLRAGIPARLSTSAGTYLCNATLYTFLDSEAARRGVPCGFVHLPYLPEQVAGLLESRQRGDLASMSLATMLEAVRIILAVSLDQGGISAGGAT